MLARTIGAHSQNCQEEKRFISVRIVALVTGYRGAEAQCYIYLLYFVNVANLKPICGRDFLWGNPGSMPSLSAVVQGRTGRPRVLVYRLGRLTNKPALKDSAAAPRSRAMSPSWVGRIWGGAPANIRFRDLFFNDRAKAVPGRSNVAGDQNHAGRKASENHSQSAPDVKRLFCQSLDGILIAFFCLVKQFVKCHCLCSGLRVPSNTEAPHDRKQMSPSSPCGRRHIGLRTDPGKHGRTLPPFRDCR